MRMEVDHSRAAAFADAFPAPTQLAHATSKSGVSATVTSPSGITIYTPMAPNAPVREVRRQIGADSGTASRHPVLDLADLLDPEAHHVAALEEFAAPGADAGRRAGQDQVPGIERHAGRQLLDLFGNVEDHVA